MRWPWWNLRVAEKRLDGSSKEKASRDESQANHSGESGTRGNTPWVGAMTTTLPSVRTWMSGSARERARVRSGSAGTARGATTLTRAGTESTAVVQAGAQGAPGAASG